MTQGSARLERAENPVLFLEVEESIDGSVGCAWMPVWVRHVLAVVGGVSVVRMDGGKVLIQCEVGFYPGMSRGIKVQSLPTRPLQTR